MKYVVHEPISNRCTTFVLCHFFFAGFFIKKKRSRGGGGGGGHLHHFGACNGTGSASGAILFVNLPCKVATSASHAIMWWLGGSGRVLHHLGPCHSSHGGYKSLCAWLLRTPSPAVTHPSFVKPFIHLSLLHNPFYHALPSHFIAFSIDVSLVVFAAASLCSCAFVAS